MSRTKPIFLQPFVTSFSVSGTLFSFRKELLAEEVAYWEENPFPKIEWREAPFGIVFYREGETVLFEEISEKETELLDCSREGMIIEELPEELRKEAERVFPRWFQLGWFSSIGTSAASSETV